MIRRLIVPLTVAVVAIHAGQAFAQGAFPAPLPGQSCARQQRFAVSAGEWRGALGVGRRSLAVSVATVPHRSPAAGSARTARRHRAARRMPA